MVSSWAGADDWSRRERAADTAPDSRDQIPTERWAALAARYAPRPAQHVGRESAQSLAGRLAALRVAHAGLCDDHAALIGRYDRLLSECADLARERDAWRYQAAEAERRADRAEAERRDRLYRWVGRLVGCTVILSLVVVAVLVLGG